MRKFISILIFLLYVSLVSAQEDSLVKWYADNPLTWEDFQGDSDSLNYVGASLKRGLNFSCNINELGVLQFELYAYYIPSKSRVNSMTDILLEHEQTHFNITEYFARLYRKKVLEFIDTVTIEYCSILGSIVSNIWAEEAKLQSQYDLETDYSRNEEKQKEWTEKVNALLEDLEAYAEPIEY